MSRSKLEPDGKCADSVRLKLEKVLACLTDPSHSPVAPSVRLAVKLPGSTQELGLFCRQYLRAHRDDWKPFLIKQVADALRRNDDGTYGRCLDCGRPIAPERLTALPWVSPCAGCQERSAGIKRDATERT
ncbi:MAG TPA: TraR/DksA family transcriptional regulator [Bryobacteraceae bacterium]|nr:TraR/DksA family transcriptional regulator [Bryobacteraceae bacterium]